MNVLPKIGRKKARTLRFWLKIFYNFTLNFISFYLELLQLSDLQMSSKQNSVDSAASQPAMTNGVSTVKARFLISTYILVSGEGILWFLTNF